jgi:hypothetical protein
VENGRVFVGGMTLAVPGATGFVALAQRAVIKQIRLHFVDYLPSRWRTIYMGTSPTAVA